jgi:integrase
VPLARSAWTALDAWGEGAPEARILGPTPETVRGHFTLLVRRACKSAGIEAFTSKGYRRLMSRRLMQAQIDAKVYEELMGHSFEVGLRWYRTEVGPLDRRAALERAGVGAPPAG